MPQGGAEPDEGGAEVGAITEADGGTAPDGAAVEVEGWLTPEEECPEPDVVGDPEPVGLGGAPLADELRGWVGADELGATGGTEVGLRGGVGARGL